MDLKGIHALVTGANRGLGRAFVDELLARGAALVHATGRDLEQLEAMASRDRERIRPVVLDVTDAVGMEAVAASLPSLDLLINNAGVDCPAALLAAEAMADIRRTLEVDFFGVLGACRAFAPVLARSPAAAVVNVGAMAGLIHLDGQAGYSAANAAQIMLSHGLRAELAGQGTRVVQVLPGFLSSDMGARLPEPKASPRAVAAATLEALVAGEDLVLPDALARRGHAALLEAPDRVLREPGAVLAELVRGLR